MNGFLAIDIFESDCYFQANKVAKSEQVAQYFADLATEYERKGVTKLAVFLDNNRTHKKKMKAFFTEMTQHLSIKIDFQYIAPYSPKLNLVEYGIHIIRQKITHHADCKTDLNKFCQNIKSDRRSGTM